MEASLRPATDRRRADPGGVPESAPASPDGPTWRCRHPRGYGFVATGCTHIGRRTWRIPCPESWSKVLGGPQVDAAVLRQAPLFSQLDDEAADALAASMTESRLRRGQVLFHEGDSGDRLFIVVEGKVKLGRTSADGRENLIAVLGPGQMFGELSL